MQLQFKELYLFSPREKLGKHIAFSPGINIITSSQVDGTNRGKSVIMRSLYHALGADALFEPNWDVKNKVFVLVFSVDESDFYILRAADLYKVFNGEKKLLFVATKARELAEKFKMITHFSVMLPSRVDGKLEITPPVYNFLPYFVDQDCYQGSDFSSFNNLSQYADFKLNVLLYHFGLFTQAYFELIRTKERLEEEIVRLEVRDKVLKEVLKSLDAKLEVKACSTDIAALQRDVEQYRKQYSETVNQLNVSKEKLIRLRNSLHDFHVAEKELNGIALNNDRALAALEHHRCPECNSEIQNPISLRGRRYNFAEDVNLIRGDIQTEIHNLKRAIAEEESSYGVLLLELRRYEDAMKVNSREITNVLRYKGFNELRSSTANEWQEAQVKMEDERVKLADVKKQKSKLDADRKNITGAYYELLLEAKTRFGLDEINPENFKDLRKKFNASGSDKNIATLIWHITLVKLRNRFNPGAIRFPLVFDSPNNVESDDQKTELLLAYLLENADLSAQFIMSGIGFDDEQFDKMVGKEFNKVVLDNAPYRLLTKDDYLKYSPLMEELLAATDK